MTTKTLAELQRDRETLPNRILAAAQIGDVQALGLLEQERATLPAALLHAELTELHTAIAEIKEEIIEAKASLLEEGGKSKALQAEEKALRQRIELQARASGLAKNKAEGLRAELLQLERRLEMVAFEQSQYAKQQTAPVVRNLVSHIPGPHRWPG
jgi:chromosome segregation ATPase